MTAENIMRLIVGLLGALSFASIAHAQDACQAQRAKLDEAKAKAAVARSNDSGYWGNRIALLESEYDECWLSDESTRQIRLDREDPMHAHCDAQKTLLDKARATQDQWSHVRVSTAQGRYDTCIRAAAKRAKESTRMAEFKAAESDGFGLDEEHRKPCGMAAKDVYLWKTNGAVPERIREAEDSLKRCITQYDQDKADAARLQLESRDPKFMRPAASARICFERAERDANLSRIREERRDARLTGVISLRNLYDAGIDAKYAAHDAAYARGVLRSLHLQPVSCNAQEIAQIFACIAENDERDGNPEAEAAAPGPCQSQVMRDKITLFWGVGAPAGN
jgi:hypothetical protein